MFQNKLYTYKLNQINEELLKLSYYVINGLIINFDKNIINQVLCDHKSINMTDNVIKCR